MQEALKLDALIIGGGVAGLWLLNRLRNEGYQALLLEQEALGTGQSIASQGMIHGGIKYALGESSPGPARQSRTCRHTGSNALKVKAMSTCRAASFYQTVITCGREAVYARVLMRFSAARHLKPKSTQLKK